MVYKDFDLATVEANFGITTVYQSFVPKNLPLFQASDRLLLDLFGCVTNAFTWAFLVLEGKDLYIDTHYVPSLLPSHMTF